MLTPTLDFEESRFLSILTFCHFLAFFKLFSSIKKFFSLFWNRPSYYGLNRSSRVSVIHSQQYFDDLNRFPRNFDIFQKNSFLAIFSDFGQLDGFHQKMKMWTNRVWERKKWFEKVVSHYYHVFLSCIGRKIEIDEKVFFSYFLTIFITIHFKGL